MDMHEIVMKLIGRIDPTGEPRTNDERYKNLEVVVELVDRLLFDIQQVSVNRDKAGQRAYAFLKELQKHGP